MMGTRFIATKESPVPQSIKDALVSSRETDTTIILRSLANQDRVLNGEVAQKVLEMDPENSKAARMLELIRSIKYIDFV